MIRIVPTWKIYGFTLWELTKKIKQHVYKPWCKIYSNIRRRIRVHGAKFHEDGRKLIGWLVGWLVGWSIGRSVVRMSRRLVGWLVGRSVGRLFGCLVGWLVGWFDGWSVGRPLSSLV
jgi:hypothetical protein